MSAFESFVDVIVREAYPNIGYNIYIIKKTAGKQHIMHDDVWEEVLDGGVVSRPTLYIPHQEILTSLLGQLQKLGIKSPDESKTQGLLEAQTEHLKDLRKLLRLS